MKSIIKREVDEHHRLIDDFLLRELTLNSGKHVASLMINDKSLHNKASLVLLSKKIFNGIALKNDSSSKYLELAKNVVHMFYKSGRNKKELREFFVELLEEEFRKFQSAENNAFVLLYSKFFLDDQLSPEVILKFLQLLDDHPVNLQTSTIISLMKYRGTGRTSSSQHLDDMDDMVDIWNITGDPTVDHGLILKTLPELEMRRARRREKNRGKEPPFQLIQPDFLLETSQPQPPSSFDDQQQNTMTNKDQPSTSSSQNARQLQKNSPASRTNQPNSSHSQQRQNSHGTSDCRPKFANEFGVPVISAIVGRKIEEIMRMRMDGDVTSIRRCFELICDNPEYAREIAWNIGIVIHDVDAEINPTDYAQDNSAFFKDQASKLFKLPNPHQWDFKRIRDVGTFMLDLFELCAVSGEVVDDWHARIQKAFEVTANRNVFLELQFITSKIKAGADARAKASESIRSLTGNMASREASDLKIRAAESTSVAVASGKFKGEGQKAATNETNEIAFEKLQKILKTIKSVKDEEIIAKVVALKIPSNPANLRKVTNMLVDKAISTSRVVLSICNVLAQLPLQSNPPINRTEFMTQVKISYQKQLRNFTKRSSKSFDAEEANQFAHLLAMLLKSSAIGNEEFSSIIENLVEDASDLNNVTLDMILRIFKEIGDDLNQIQGQSLDNVELLLRALSTEAPKKAKKVIKEILSLLKRKQISAVKDSEKFEPPEQVQLPVEAFEPSQSAREGLSPSLNVTTKVLFTELLTNLLRRLQDDDEDLQSVFCNFIFANGSVDDLIQVLWKRILVKTDHVQLYASLFSVSSASRNVNEPLIEFLDRRVGTFTSIPDQHFTEPIRSKLSNVLMFIAHLYTLNFVPDIHLESLMRPAKHLSLETLHSLVAVLTPKIKDENVRMKAFLDGLEKLAHQSLMEALKDLNIDIKELKNEN